MHVAATEEWRLQLILNRDLRTAAARSELGRRVARGDLVRVVRGAYLPAALWRAADREHRFRMRVQAVAAMSSEELVLSHASAAVMWGLPWSGPWPDRVEALASRTYGGHSTATICRRVPAASGDPVVIDGLLVTDLARTVVDLARSPGFTRAVVVGDAALNTDVRGSLPIPRNLDIDALHAALEACRNGYGSARARDVLGFVDGLSGSPGESVSRVSCWRAGVPSPVLQQPFAPWFVDFWWPEFGIIGEFDGDKKYLDASMRSGRSAEQVVLDEKRREDDLRRRSRGFARWDWRVANSPAALADRLARAGMPRR